MNSRTFVVASLHVPADRRGYDAIDYVFLHGAVRVYEADSAVRRIGVYNKEAPVRLVSTFIRESPVRPTDVTGVSINEGYDPHNDG